MHRRRTLRFRADARGLARARPPCQYPLQFVESTGIGQATDAAAFQGVHQGNGIGIGPVKQVEDHIGIEDEAQHGGGL